MPVVIEVVMAVSDLARDTPEEKRIDREEYECVDEADRGDAEVEDAPLHWVHYPALTIQRERDKPRLALNNITAGVRERADTNRTREAGHLDEIQGAVANTLVVIRLGGRRLHRWVRCFRKRRKSMAIKAIAVAARTA